MNYQDPLPDADVTEKIIGVFWSQALPAVRALGATRTDEIVKVLRRTLGEAGFQTIQPRTVRMRDQARTVGVYQVHLIVNRRYAIVVKHVKRVSPRERTRLAGALRALNLPIGLIFNFGETRKRVHRVDVPIR